ncbi:MAG: murein L,D-transpeptidase [Enterobacteriaceae bacterium]|jgi:murein L,D-transpeptidase YafK|nr:murein L,D-transpeptidase [Enterobacteriaceae bacterium]
MKKTISYLCRYLLLFLPLLCANMSFSVLAENTWLQHQSFLKNTPLQHIGANIFIQIFKEEKLLELYTQNTTGRYQLIQQYPICNYSGGLGPKTLTGDFKSPEGFYSVTLQQLKPDSQYHRAINLGFPNEFDQYRGYSGKNLMIHGACKSIGCYAMTDRYISEIYQYAESALHHGQQEIKIDIYPFRMTPSNMMHYRNNTHYAFWKQLQPAYEYFVKNGRPATVTVTGGQYVVNPPSSPLGQKPSSYALTKVE